ncbi:hypothetical protein ACFCXA_19110 [Streptomyces virginiae]
MVDSARISASLRRVAFDVDELARARRVEDLTGARVGNALLGGAMPPAR